MEDIKLLYTTAKTRGWNTDISTYIESVNNLLDSNPNEYVMNLEYIITSSPGAESFLEFVDKYGLCLGLYNEAMDLINESIHRCERDNKPVDVFIKTKEWLESFHKDHVNEFAMYEWYTESWNDEYIKTYYGFNKDGIQNRKLVKGMIEKFGECAVPDIIITAKNIGKKATKSAINFIEKQCIFESPLFFEYLSSICELSGDTKKKTASSIVKQMKARNNEIYRESVIIGNDDLLYEYSKNEIEAIRDLLSYKEYKILWADETGISMNETANEIYSLYEEIDGMEFMESDETNKDKDDLVPIFCLLQHFEDDGSFPDSVKKNEKWKRNVNICKTINKYSHGDQYSHAVIAFDEECKEMYGFESMGIVKDSWDSELWAYTTSIYMCCLFVPKEDKERMHDLCKNFANAPETTKYAYSDLIRLFIGSKVPKEDKRFICSGFTAFVLALSNPKNLHKDYSRMRPDDITILPRSFYIINVKNGEDFAAHKQEIRDKVAAIKNENLEELEDYNNNLPKILLQDTMRKRKTLDKILDAIIGKKFIPTNENENKKEE